MVETMNYQFDILRGDEFEGHLLWERLANHSVHVLVAERVNDFAAPCFMNLRCRVVLFQLASFALMVG